MKKVTILGLGYVGFPLMCAIAKSGKYNTCGYDPSEFQIDKINKGICPIDDEIAMKDMKEVSYEVSQDIQILEDTDIFIICVPTPVDELYIPDLRPVMSATKMVLSYMKKGDSVIIESTINPGICEEVVLPILESGGMKGGVDFELAHCPERINPGDEKWNVYNIPRNIGALSKDGCKYLADVYRNFLHAEVNEMATIQEAEATKIIENTFRDINIAYVNELSKSFDKLGIDLVNVIKGASNKPFGFMAHYPGCGVGGHCIAVDPYYLIEKAKKVGFDHKFLRTARTINNSMPEYTVNKLVLALNKINKSVKGTKIGLLGLSYKRDVGDLRESPSFKIKSILENQYEAKLNVFDPFFDDLSTHNSLESFIDDCEVIILATNHTMFTDFSFEDNNTIKVIIDGRNCLDKERIIEKGIIYHGIGR